MRGVIMEFWLPQPNRGRYTSDLSFWGWVTEVLLGGTGLRV